MYAFYITIPYAKEITVNIYSKITINVQGGTEELRSEV